MMCEDCIMYGRCRYYVCPRTRYDEESEKQSNSTSDNEFAIKQTDNSICKVSEVSMNQEQSQDIEYHVLQYESIYSSIAFYPD